VPPVAQQFTSLFIRESFSLILSWAAEFVDIGTFFGVLTNMATGDDGLVVRTLCDRGPMLFKCTIKPRIPNAKESLLAALQDW
jgi:hypothetical protein